MIDPAAQMQMAKRAGSTITSVNSSHLSLLAKPREVATVIMTAAAAAGKGKPAS